MKSLNRRMLRYSACLFLLATVAAWPTAGWSQTCDRDTIVKERLENWAEKLKESWSTPVGINPGPIISTYAADGVLLPTCSNGPLIGRDTEIKDYFKDTFLPLKPVAKFDFGLRKFEVGGDCTHPFASGVYDFESNKGPLKARYTYVFRRTGPQTNEWLIAQHHSSLMLDPEQKCPPKEP
jgi:hypothetical protein